MGKDQSNSVSLLDARAKTSSVEASASAGGFKLIPRLASKVLYCGFSGVNLWICYYASYK
jgi:hypothetical protein